MRSARRKAGARKRPLTRVEHAAQLICQTVYRGNCAWAEGTPATCSLMRFAATRVINLIEGRDPEPTDEQRRALRP
jgi:hypothetical protein